jgi:hypothetical protein
MRNHRRTPFVCALAALFALGGLPRANAQQMDHQHHHDATPTPTPTPPPSANPEPIAMTESMPAADEWMTMIHGFAFLTANRQGGPSGDRDFDSENHFMVAATHGLWGGKISLLGTFTVEPLTVVPSGQRELFQRGETYQGVLLVDKQHPHDLLVQIAAAWEHAAGPVSLRLYVAPIGEPALGPTAYPHRLSASENPTAPLGHHNQDSTHISYDVLTAGVIHRLFTLEGSLFHGAEPDENRFNVEQGRLDSYSGRLTLRPAVGLSLQVSTGHLEHPEALEKGNQIRTTVSVTYEKTFAGGFLAASLIAGRNRTPEGPEWGSGLEWTWKMLERNYVFGRIERVDRDVYELVNKRQRPKGVAPERIHVDAATLGYTRDLPLLKDVELGLGGDVTLYSFPSRLDPIYGSSPVSVHGFVRVRFGTHGGAHEMDHAHMHM